jgi:hypothetical protein
MAGGLFQSFVIALSGTFSGYKQGKTGNYGNKLPNE